MLNATSPLRTGSLVVLCGVIAIAFRELASGTATSHLDSAVFLIGALPAPVVLAVAGWLAWQRRAPWHAPRSQSHVWFTTLGLAAVAVFAWARAIGKTDLLFGALALTFLTLVGLFADRTTRRRQLAPALVLLFGFSIPHPLESEIVWRLQLWTARWANELLQLGSREFKRAGVVLRDGEHTFQVVDSCSGLTGILILLLVACLVRELFDLGKVRSTILFLATVGIGFVVNVFRAIYVASSPNPEELAGVGADHTLQGVVVLMLGTALVYAMAFRLDEGRQEDDSGADSLQPESRAESRAETEPEAQSTNAPPRASLILAALLSSLLLGLSFALPAGFLAAGETPGPVEISFPTKGTGWTSEEAPPEHLFNGHYIQLFNRRFTRTGESGPLPFMDVFIGQGIRESDYATRGFSSKRLYPGPNWDLVSRERKRAWSLGREVDRVIAAPEPEANREHAVLYVWKTGEGSLPVESLRSFLGLDDLAGGGVGGAQLPVVVKLIAYAPHGGELHIDRAEQRIERFIRDHGEAMRALAGTPGPRSKR